MHATQGGCCCDELFARRRIKNGMQQWEEAARERVERGHIGTFGRQYLLQHTANLLRTSKRVSAISGSSSAFVRIQRRDVYILLGGSTERLGELPAFRLWPATKRTAAESTPGRLARLHHRRRSHSRPISYINRLDQSEPAGWLVSDWRDPAVAWVGF